MNYDTNQLKNLIFKAKPQEMLVLSVNKLEKNSLKLCQNEIDKFVKKDQDYVVIAIRR
jgi:hypothetical protein